jgi:membrane fusion protein (multidrug efflux system)
MSRRVIPVALVVAALAVAVAASLHSGRAVARASVPEVPPPVRVRTIKAGGPVGGAAVPANVLAARRATLSTRVAAAVQAVHVREGQRVGQGQLLVSLSDGDLRGALAAGEASLAAASTHERRIRDLAGRRAATPSELEAAGAQRAQAEAAVAAARANLSYTGIRAPFAGTIQARRIDPGDLVGPGQPLVEIEGDALELVASLSEQEARALVLGATLRFRAGDAQGTAVVSALTPGGDPLSHRRGLRARVEKVEGELRSGAFARIEVPGAGGGGAREVWIPRSALVERGDLTGVFVATGGRAQLRWIALGEPAGEFVAVRAGLRPGDSIVDGPGALRDGQAVEVLP